ncbi:leucine-rich repeat extensin-like protein 3 [Camellia sinensis]|uniref:leucine-rich repeat extensin-like protein 3 n=1 Tax=Camellia sinensis TaxID=4442 RepID=UPI0010369A89|nr:leucine-rich repeat extensin-like protein 3 [Camellia sinensis]
MADSPPSPATTEPNPQPSDPPENPPSQSNQPDPSPPPQSSSAPSTSLLVNPNPNPNPTPPPQIIYPYALPQVPAVAPTAPSFRLVPPPVPVSSAPPQFSPLPVPNFHNPNFQSSVGVQPPGVSMMQTYAPPGQPPNPAFRHYAPMPNGYPAIPTPQGTIPPPGGLFCLSLCLCLSILFRYMCLYVYECYHLHDQVPCFQFLVDRIAIVRSYSVMKN